MESIMVEHDEKTKSFYLLEDGYKAFICYEVQNGEFDVLTTQVPKAISGRGLASQLMKACASFVKEKGLKFKGSSLKMGVYIFIIMCKPSM